MAAFDRSEALRLLQEAGLGGQRHQGRGQAAEAHPRAEVEVGGGQQGLEDADEAEGGAAVGDEVDLVAVGAQEGRDLLLRFGPGNTHTKTFSLHYSCTNPSFLHFTPLMNRKEFLLHFPENVC